MKIYISGPMTGHPDFNFPAFHAVAALLRAQGYAVVNPAELNSHDTPYADALRNDIRALLECDAIYFMPGWSASRGAKCEREIATVLDLDFLWEGEVLTLNLPATPGPRLPTPANGVSNGS